MANPQKENGYTAIANELLEALIKYDFPSKTSLPQRICLFVIRKTYGYQKKEDTISLTQFQLAVNEKNRTNLVYWLNYLVQALILIKTKLKNNHVKYRLNKDYDQWKPLVQVRLLVQVRKWTSASTDTKTSASTCTHKRKKEKNKRNNAETSSATPFSFKEYLKELENHKARHVNVIGHFFEEKGLIYDTREKANTAVKRHLRPAVEVAKFSDSEIVKATNEAVKQYKDLWTVETILKILTR